MATVGGVIETKQIGLSINLNGTNNNTEVVNGVLKLEEKSNFGTVIYADSGEWISEPLDLGDKFNDYDKLFVTNVLNGNSSYEVETRVSDDGTTWDGWVSVLSDGTIQSDTKQFIQVKIILHAGFTRGANLFDKSEYTSNNEYVENEIIKEGAYAVPILTSATSSTEGFAFSTGSYSSNNAEFNVFRDTGVFYSTTATKGNGFVGFYFEEKRAISKYMINHTSASNTPKDFVLEASNDTTTGLDGAWVVLDTRNNITDWGTQNTKEYELENIKKYHAYRIRWFGSNSPNGLYTAISRINFFEREVTNLKLKREYEYDMALDTTWTEDGSLHRQKIIRDKWLRIDKIDVLHKI